MASLAPIEGWTTKSVPTSDQYDAWVGKLNGTFGRWNATVRGREAFRADVRASGLPDFSLIDCKCDPCGGERSRADLSTVESEQLTIQLVLSGREHMRLGEQEAILSKGDIFVWDNTQAMSFSVIEPLHKISLVLPLQRLKDWVPNKWREMPRWMRNGEPGTEMLASYIRYLSEVDYQSNPMRHNALVEAAIALLVAPMPDAAGDGSHRLAQLEIVKSKIRQRLRDPDLDLAAIAHANCISLRYLHWLFEVDDTTAWRFIVSERLEGCRRDLVNPALRSKSITVIAFSWGFSNIAHFARKVKACYGLTPTELRAGFQPR